VSYQITGMPPFTENEFSTVGNDWGIAKKLLTPENVTAIENIVNEIGQKMYADGWRGLFGVDVIRDDASKRMFLIEVNARQPASATFESTLQEKAREKGVRGLTTFEAHIRALLGLPIDQELIAINDGAQIVQRVTKNVQGVFDDVTGSLKSIGYDVIAYQNTAHNSDLLRIQSSVSIMDSHKAFNSKGKEILNEIKGSQIKIQV
jgi:formate-dependent phosphoribosylglycinamide formyltransferase (GAR transformylase)